VTAAWLVALAIATAADGLRQVWTCLDRGDAVGAQAALAPVGRPADDTTLASWVDARCRLAWAAGRMDEAFARLDAFAASGYAAPDLIEGEDFDRSMPHAIKSDPRWGEFVRRVSQNKSRLLASLDPASLGVLDNPAWAELERHAADPSIPPAELLQELRGFQRYPAPARTDTWVEYQVPVKEGFNAPSYI